MARFRTKHASMTAGVITPRMDARADVARYQNGARVLSNWLVEPWGPATRRGALRYVAEVKASAKRTALIRFEYNDEQAYILELGDGHLRFYKDKGQIVSGGSAYEIAAPWAQADLFDGDGRLRVKFVQTNDVMWLFHPDYQPRVLTRTGHTSWTLSTLAFVDGPYLPVPGVSSMTLGGTTGSVTVTIASANALNGGDGFQSTDVGRLIRYQDPSDNAWTWLEITAVSTTTECTATIKGDDAATGGASSNFRFGVYSDTTGWPRCGALYEERLYMAGAAIRPSRFDGTVTGGFDDTSADFTPGPDDADAVAFDIGEGDILYWLSPGADLMAGGLGQVFRITKDVTSATITPSSVDVRRAVRYGSADMPPVEGPYALLFVQRGGHFLRELADPDGLDRWRAPDMAIVAEHLRRSPFIAMAYVATPRPMVWVARADGRLLSFTYDRDEKTLGWAPHPLGGDAAVESIAAIPGDDADELWCIAKLTVDGATKRYVAVMEQPLPDHEPQETAFYVDFGLSLDNTVAQTLTPGATTGTGVTFTAGGSVFASSDVGRFIKYRYQDGTDLRDNPVYATAVAEITAYSSGTEVTCDILVDFPSTDAIAASDWRMTVETVSGLGHLEGETVQVLGDGAVLDEATVVSGSIALSAPAAEVHAGLGYAADFMPEPLDLGGPGTTSDGSKVSVDQVTVRLHRTLGIKLGANEDTLEEVAFRDDDDLMDRAPPLFSGEKDIPLGDDWDSDPFVLIRADQPLPATVLSVAPRVTQEPG